MSPDTHASSHLSTLPPASEPDRDQQYWRDNLGLTAVLLVLWFVVTFCFVFWAGELNFTFFGWPFSFWMAAQGALLVYCAIVWYYAWAMGRRDEEYRAAGDDDTRP